MRSYHILILAAASGLRRAENRRWTEVLSFPGNASTICRVQLGYAHEKMLLKLREGVSQEHISASQEALNLIRKDLSASKKRQIDLEAVFVVALRSKFVVSFGEVCGRIS